MASTLYQAVDLCAVRVAKLTEGGAPLTGATNGYISDGAVTMGIGITTEAGDDITQKNGCGNICATLQSPDLIKGLTLDIDFCRLDAYLYELLTGSDTFTSGADAVGFQFAAVGAAPGPVCFEGWSKAWDVDHQATDAFTSPDATWIHWVFPYTRWVQGDITVEHGIDVYPASAKGSENSAITADGPFNDWPAPVSAHGGVTRVGGWFFDDDIPVVTANKVPVTSSAS
jgi:hypothetical protein